MLTAFDFDNCCRHWLMYDLVVARSVLAKFADADRSMRWIIAGYEARTPLPGDLHLANLLGRVRLLYVLCDRLCMAGNAGTGVSAADVGRLRTRFLQAVAGDAQRFR